MHSNTLPNYSPLLEIKKTIELQEQNRVHDVFTEMEAKDNDFEKFFTITEKASLFLEGLAIFTVGFATAVVTLVLNYFVFVWLLHLQF